MPPASAARWDHVPVALLLLDDEARVLDVNEELVRLVGVEDAREVVGRRLGDLLTVGGRIYWETHLSPHLRIGGRVDEVAVELRTSAGREPVLLTAVAREHDEQRVVDVAMLSARARVRFEEELVEARREAEAAERRVRTLHAVAADLASVAGLDAVAWVLLRAAVTTLGGGDVALWVTEEGRPLRRWGGAFDLEPPALEELSGTTARPGGDVVVPLRTAGTLLGVLVVAPRRAPGADPLDTGTLTAAGQLAALALARAGTHEQSVSVATELQRAMLADGLVDDARVDVAAEYRPGVHGLHVGGDWYDTFRIAPDVLALSVGDVVGRGLTAATAMGQLRTVTRAVADPGRSTEHVLGALDRFVERTGTGFMASTVHAQLDLRTGTLRYSSAGHLPPVLVRPGGDATLLWDARSAPLGVRGSRARTAETVELSPGDVLVLYTDGVVERRDRPLPTGLDELATAARAAVGDGGDVADVPARLVAASPGDDDACVLAVRWRGAEVATASPA
jgi:hypothetical protein